MLKNYYKSKSKIPETASLPVSLTNSKHSLNPENLENIKLPPSKYLNMAKLIVLVVVACTLAVDALGPSYQYPPYGSGQVASSALGAEFNQQSLSNENHDKKNFGLNFSSDKGSSSSSNNVNAQIAGSGATAQGPGVLYPQPYQQVQYQQPGLYQQYPQVYQQPGQYPQQVINPYAYPYPTYQYPQVSYPATQVPQVSYPATQVPQVPQTRPTAVTGGWGR